MSAIKFSLDDSNGESHNYTMTLHLGGEGSLLAMQIMGFVAEPAIGAMLGLFDRATGSVTDLLSLDVSALLDGIDAASVGPAIAGVLADPKTHRIVKRDLVKYVHRDGKPLSNDTNFDQAFQGNYAELFKLCWEVAKSNRFLPLGSTS